MMLRRLIPLLLPSLTTFAQIDQQRAAEAFEQAKTLCERDGGKLWKVSLCGPIVIADPATRTIATNQPAPAGDRPPALGFANSAVEWGGARWTTISWPLLVALRQVQGMLLIHELFHRIQPQLGLLVADAPSDHLDTLEGRYWMQLEWKALSRAISSPRGPARAAAVGDALAFRAARRGRFPGAAESERGFEINEGLAQYTATVVAAASRSEALRSALGQLEKAPDEVTFVRQFAYPNGAAYGVLLDEYDPQWTHRIKSTDDLGKLLEPFAASRSAAAELEEAAASYGGPEIRERETRRDVEHKARVAELRRRFIEGPVLVLPRGRGASFGSAGITVLPGEGTVYRSYRTKAEWGTLEASAVLVGVARGTLSVPAPPASPPAGAKTLKGDGWTLEIADGWVVRPGPRSGDFQLVAER